MQVVILSLFTCFSIFLILVRLKIQRSEIRYDKFIDELGNQPSSTNDKFNDSRHTIFKQRYDLYQKVCQEIKNSDQNFRAPNLTASFLHLNDQIYPANTIVNQNSNLYTEWNPLKLTNSRYACFKYGPELKYNSNSKNLVQTSPNNQKFLFCIPPKTGTTNWQKLLIAGILEKVSDPKSVKYSDFANLYEVVPNIAILYKKIFNRMPNYKTNPLQKSSRTWELIHNHLLQRSDQINILNVRHPVERLYSAWRDKFRTEKPQNIQAWYIKFHLDKFPKQYENYKPDSMSISWPDFVNYWLQNYQTETKFDHHWHTTIWTCLPCSYDFQYIVKTETADTDSELIIDLIFPHLSAESKKLMKIPPKYGLPTYDPENFPKSELSGYTTAYLPEDFKTKLREAFYWDLKMFGYEY